MSPAVPFSSILVDCPSDMGEREDMSMFGDLNLDQVFAAVAAGRDEYDLMPFFRSPLRDVRAVEYRHQVQRDLEDKTLSNAVAEFALRMREMREHLALSGKLRTRYQKEHWFLAAAGVYRRAVVTLADALAGIGLRSRGFTAFRQYLEDYTQSAAFTGLAADIARVTSALDDVRYCVNIKGNRVRVTGYDGEADYGAEVQRTFAKFAENPVKDYRVGFRGLPDMDHVEARILGLVARLYPDAFGALDEFCARHAAYLDETIRVFDREVQFYAAYQDFTAPMKKAGLDFCYPAVSAGSKEISARRLIRSRAGGQAHAAGRRGRAQRLLPHRPGTHLRGDRAQNGRQDDVRADVRPAALPGQPRLPGPGPRRGLFLPDRVFTHFEQEEDLATLRGKFEDELVRIRERAGAGDRGQRRRDERELRVDHAAGRRERGRAGAGPADRPGAARRVRHLRR